MKRLRIALILCTLTLSFCPAQTQPGNASFNPTKPGMTISHSSLSFNTHVRVTNLRNNRSVEAIVNDRIPITSERIADISREAGIALDMDPAILTPVEIEVLAGRGGEPVRAEAAPVLTAAAETPPPAGLAVPAPVPQQPLPAVSPGQAAPPPAQILPIQTVTDIQYVPVPAPVQSCCNSPLMIVVLALLIVAIILLLVILILLLRRLLLWPWHYKTWYRRHLLYAKRRRRETGP
jgi:hypothetical protein